MAVLNEFCAASLGSADRERLRAVMEPVLYHMPYATPQFELWDLDDDQWRNVMSGQCPTSALRTWRLAPMDCNSYLVITAIVSHEVGIARTAGRSLAGNYAAVFVDGTDHLVDGMAQPLVFPEMVTADRTSLT
jgi:hypothetical protein